MKNPALSLINAIKLLLTEDFGTLNPTQKELLKTAYESCLYENELISLIMDCYKYENGQLAISYKNFNIIDLLSEIENGISLKIKEKRQHLKLLNHLSDNIILADRLHLKRVITNFLTNAVTYSGKDTDIEIVLKSENGLFELEVLNMSLIKPSENMDSVFEKFKTYKNSKYNKTSVGLGLYISKQIIQAHKGKIYAKILPDDRCLFGFRIPLKKGLISTITKEK